jgi:hypothetical protein
VGEAEWEKPRGRGRRTLSMAHILSIGLYGLTFSTDRSIIWDRNRHCRILGKNLGLDPTLSITGTTRHCRVTG